MGKKEFIMTQNEWVQHIVQVIDDKKGQDIQIIPVHSFFAEYFVVASAMSSRHLWSVAEAVEMECKKHGIRPISQGKKAPPVRRGQETPEIRWVVVDAGGIIVHLFSPEARAYYALEELWTKTESPLPEAEANATSVPQVPGA